ncbi:MAG: DUF1501 domain-containing protein [Candidatus Tectomicrobia bacterium]|uniref:DUF1501 domain-containing protein n=1 Tax=Tectimicrobiota bacterium TaxID=2528274 RepID=A0A937W0G8_UNCTE|nr:DUF1501 domain-containing protein [Candidatus Tectomicrobia bacterium]
MANQSKRAIVVIQLAGANDALNTVVPYTNGLYYDFRPHISIAPEAVLPLDAHYGFHPEMGPVKALWDQGKVALINGIGYPNPDRSHFRSMDIWHTAEPTKIGTEGWLGRAIRELDPQGGNVLTGVHFGRGLPRSLACKGVPVASVGNLATYGVFPDLKDEARRLDALETFSQMYGGAQGRDVVLDVLGQNGRDALKGADILKTAPARYTSTVQYEANPIAQSLKSMAQVMFADLGTQLYYTLYGSFDTHGGELIAHAKLWQQVAGAVGSFYADLVEHGRENDTLIFIWTEFGRRIRDNGTGTDHGSGGTAFVIGGAVNGGMYGEYPSLKPEEQLNGDLHYNNDFRSTYATMLERWLGIPAAPIVNGHFEQFDFVSQ